MRSRINFDDELTAVKTRLKSAKVKVGLVVARDTIQLQATLPIKPGDRDNGTGRKQYKISLNIPASLDGLKTAEEEANELGRLIARKQFEWNDKYLGQTRDGNLKTIGDVLPGFEAEYFKTRKLTEKSKHTFSYYKDYLRRLVGENTLLSQESIEAKLAEIEHESVRYNVLKAMRVLINTLSISTINLTDFKYSQPASQHRRIPTDEEVINNYQRFEYYALSRNQTIKKDKLDSWKLWRWVYGMLATYGLRPREVFVNPDINWWLSSDNKDNIWKVHPDTKTGYREALPLHPEWVELFDLTNPEYLDLLTKEISGKFSFSQINIIRVNCSSWFRRVDIPFTPYDLRHAWAIRAHIMGIPVKASADNLGHSVEVHTDIYQKWFGLENRKKVIRQAVDKKDELASLRLENVQLRAEVAYLRNIISEHRIEVSAIAFTP